MENLEKIEFLLENREVYLYRCDRCGTALIIYNDKGAKFYLDQCAACKEWSDYEKVNVGRRCLYVEGEKEDGSKERKADEH